MPYQIMILNKVSTFTDRLVYLFNRATWFFSIISVSQREPAKPNSIGAVSGCLTMSPNLSELVEQSLAVWVLVPGDSTELL